MNLQVKRICFLVSAFVCVVALFACQAGIIDFPGAAKTGETTEASETTSATQTSTAISQASETETTADPGPLTDEQALEAFTNYLYHKIKNLQQILDEGKKPCTWGIASSDEKKITIMFKSYTGGLFKYHIDRKTGKTYVTHYVVSSNSYIRTKENFNIRDYIDKKPTPTPVVIKPSGKDTAAPTAKPKVKVSSAVSKISYVGSAKLPYKIPQVSISGKNTDAVNKKIKSDLGKVPLKGSGARGINYSYYANSKIVSILVCISDNDKKTVNTYKAYNISVSTGKFVKDKEVIKLYGTTTKKFFAKVRTTYKKFGGGPSAPGSVKKKLIKKNRKRVTYKHLEPYIGKNGHLCFIGYVEYYGGAGKGYRVFDATKRKLLA